MGDYLTFLKKLHVNLRSLWRPSVLVFISLIACTKNNNEKQVDLTGTWKLAGSTGTFENWLTYERNDTLIKQTESQTYYSTSVTGTETFSGDTAVTNGFFVHAAITQNNAEYFNGALSQDTTINYEYEYQNWNNAISNFELIGRDSIHLFGGPGIPLTAGLVPGGTDGGKYIISGDTLTLTTHVNINDSASPSNVQHGLRTIVTVLIRQ